MQLVNTLLGQAAPAAVDLGEQLSWENIRTVLSPLILFATGSLILVVDLFLRGWSEPARPGEKSGLHFVALLGTLLAATFTLASFQSGEEGSFFAGSLRVDAFTNTVSLFILVGTFLSLLGAVDYLNRRGIEHGEFHCLVLCAAAAMILFTESNNIIMLFLSLETLSMALYVLAAFFRDEKRSVEGALKYFILGGFSSGFLLLGLVFLYGATREIEIAAMLEAIREGPDVPLLLAGIGLTFVGLAFKVGAFPFHAWVPDAYEGAPAVGTGFMAVTVKIAAFAVLLRIAANLAGAEAPEEARELLVAVTSVIALVTMVFGNLVALVQSNVKRMLAYSAIAHTGYLLVGIASSVSREGAGDAAAAVVFYLLPYGIMTVAAFTLLNFASGDGDRELFSDYRGLAQERPALALGLLVVLVSYAGLPPTAGFWAKLFIFREAVTGGHWFLALVGILTSIISVYYYLRLVVNFYMVAPEPESAGTPPGAEADSRLASALVVGTAATALLLIGIFPDAWYRLSLDSVASLLLR